jgi:hypothetical protein
MPADDEHEATLTVDCAFDGVNYTLDLCEPHREAMGKAVSEYVAASLINVDAVAPRGRRSYRAASTNGGHGYRTPEREGRAQIRTWAREQAHQVSNRARLSAEIEALYNQSVRDASL